MDVYGLDDLVRPVNGMEAGARDKTDYVAKLSALVDNGGSAMRGGEDAEAKERQQQADEHVRRLAYGSIDGRVPDGGDFAGVHDHIDLDLHRKRGDLAAPSGAAAANADGTGISTRKVRKDRPADITISDRPLLGSRHLLNFAALTAGKAGTSGTLYSPSRIADSHSQSSAIHLHSPSSSASLKQYSLTGLADLASASTLPSPAISLTLQPDSAVSTSFGGQSQSIIVDLTSPSLDPCPRPRVRFASSPLHQTATSAEAEMRPKVWEPFLPVPSRPQYEIPPHRSWNEALEKPTQQLTLWREYVGSVIEYCTNNVRPSGVLQSAVAHDKQEAEIASIPDPDALLQNLATQSATLAILTEAGDRMAVEIDRLVAKAEHHRLRAEEHRLALVQRDEFLTDIKAAYTRADDDAAELEVKVMRLEKQLGRQEAALGNKRSKVELYTDTAIAWDELARVKRKLRARDEEVAALRERLEEYQRLERGVHVKRSKLDKNSSRDKQTVIREVSANQPSSSAAASDAPPSRSIPPLTFPHGKLRTDGAAQAEEEAQSLFRDELPTSQHQGVGPGGDLAERTFSHMESPQGGQQVPSRTVAPPKVSLDPTPWAVKKAEIERMLASGELKRYIPPGPGAYSGARSTFDLSPSSARPRLGTDGAMTRGGTIPSVVPSPLIPTTPLQPAHGPSLDRSPMGKGVSDGSVDGQGMLSNMTWRTLSGDSHHAANSGTNGPDLSKGHT